MTSVNSQRSMERPMESTDSFVPNPSQSSLLQPGHNCWRKARAQRAAFLIDGADYFAAFCAAAEQAQRSILIIGWDIDSRTLLKRDHPSQEHAYRLGDFLNNLVKRRQSLHAHVLIWDFAMIYALEREPLPVYKLDWLTHRRLRFVMDEKHPFGASHHQKIVVIDDKVAFVGGFDLSKSRWDTSQHAAYDPRRVNPDGNLYPPFHDVQMLVDGEAAAALGELARQRWQRATGKQLRPLRPRAAACDPWPKDVNVVMQDVDIAIARTEPAYHHNPGVHEVKHLYSDAIAAARHSIYIENQYLTSAMASAALAERLQTPQGPDIILVLPYQTSGWLEQTTMDVLRARQLKRLRDADRYGRLRIYYPDAPGLSPDHCINMHAKLLIVDDTLVRVGSSNLSNRSMGLDTECDLAVEAGGREDVRSAIANLRNRLLGEHLGVEPAIVARAIAQKDSLIKAVEALRGGACGSACGGERTLRDLDGSVSEALDAVVPEATVIDPKKPLDMDRLTRQILPNDRRSSRYRRYAWMKAAAAVAVLLALAGMWRWTPLSNWLNVDYLAGWAEGISHHPLGPLAVLLGFLIGGLTAFPVTVLIVATALLFGPFLGFTYALVGTGAAATLTYAIGHYLGRDTVQRLGGARLNRLSRGLARRGILAVAVVRMMPVAPFTVVNLVAGASHIRFRDYALGTLLGMAPGMLALTVFADGIYRAMRNPEPATLAWVAVIMAAVGGGAYLLRRWLKQRELTAALSQKG